ncbi:MAG: P-II family nitrogen regulator [Candidatus Eiseniibacteriota bacterium]
MREIKAIIQPFMLEHVLRALAAIEGLPGLTVSQVLGWGRSRAAEAGDSVSHAGHAFANKAKLELVVPDELAPRVVETIAQAARTGRPGDGKIFEYEVGRVVRVRTGQEGSEAL